MLKRISVLILICLANLCISAQTEKYTAPVKWERYKVSDKNASVLLPKLPVLVENTDSCAETEKREYAVFAEDVVYGFNITFQTEQKAPDFCRESKDSRKFDEKRFDDRLNELAISLKTEKKEKFTRNNLEITKVSNKFFAYWLINDFKNKRWFEIWTTEQDETNLNVKNFIESFRIEKKSIGIEIGKGSPRTLGDENVVNKTDTDKEMLEKTEGLRILLKPRPKYTDAARQAQTQGTVMLRVTFLASGAIGSVTPVSGLPYGITEQAMEAAHRIVFLPAKKSGYSVSVTKQVQYSFSIY